MIPSGSGKKDNERNNIRKRTVKPSRDVSQYGNRIDEESSDECESTPYKVVFVTATKATTCYGCKGRICDKPSVQPPPVPQPSSKGNKDTQHERTRACILPSHPYMYPYCSEGQHLDSGSDSLQISRFQQTAPVARIWSSTVRENVATSSQN